MNNASIAYQYVVELISKLNSVTDKCDSAVISTQQNYRTQRQKLQDDCTAFEKTRKKKLGNQINQLKTNASFLISNAKNISSQIDDIEARLMSVDKYYIRTKNAKEDALKGTTSQKYSGNDYFKILKDIQDEFTVLSRKYSEDILPALINGLNYFFSSKRKKDYEDLIILKHTVKHLIEEMEDVLPLVTDDTVKSLEDEYSKAVSESNEKYRRLIEEDDERYSLQMRQLNEWVKAEINGIVDDNFLKLLSLNEAVYLSEWSKVHSGSAPVNGLIYTGWVNYPFMEFAQSGIVRNAINTKFSQLAIDDNICFPISVFVDTPMPIFFDRRNTNVDVICTAIYGIMYSFLSLFPVSTLTFDVFDPENHGNSVSPYFDAKKRLPSLFDEKIFIDREDIAKKLHSVNEYVEDIVQNMLGTRYRNIYELADTSENVKVQAKLLVLFDFPKNMDERTLSEVKNIVEVGGRCGVYTIIVGNRGEQLPNQSFTKTIKNIYDNCAFLEGNYLSFFGMPMQLRSMPEKNEFDRFFSKYMLMYESIRNKGIAFMSVVKQLCDAKTNEELFPIITYIRRDAAISEKYGTVSETISEFPRELVIGDIHYPKDVFSDCFAYSGLCKYFMDTSERIALPFSLDLTKNANIIVNCSEKTVVTAQSLTHSIIWNFISQLPVTKTNICVFDGKQRGLSLGSLMKLREKLPDLFDESVYTNSDNIRCRLTELCDMVDDRVQSKLGGIYSDIIAYNENTPNRQEICTLLVIYDFPTAFDNKTIELLQNIIENGTKCGIFTVICNNSSVEYLHYDSIENVLEKMRKYSAELVVNENEYALMPFNIPITVQEPLNICETEEFGNTYFEVSEKIKRRGIPFTGILDSELFSRYSGSLLTIPIGIGDGEKVISLDIGGKGSSHHCLIGGGTGGGKSTLLHTMIMSAMLHYTPDDLHLYLLDFKGGIEFKIYDTYRLPHIKLLAVDAMQEFGWSILKELEKELDRRSNLCKEAGASGFKSYREVTGKPMPRILIVMDEFQILYNDATNRKVAAACAQLTKRIVTEGRAYGLHLVMATQSTKIVRNLTLEAGTIEQMRIRIGLKCNPDDTMYLFSSENERDAQEKMKGPVGTAVMNLDFTEQANIDLRVAYCDDDTQHKYLKLIEEKYKDMPHVCQTFEGSSKTALIDYFRKNNIGYTAELPALIHMGEKIEVAPPFVITADRKKKHNLLICGSNDQMTRNITNNYIISALLNTRSEVYCIDGDILIGESDSFDVYNVLRKYTSRFHNAENCENIIKFINAAYDKLIERKKQLSLDPIFIVIKNLQYLDLVQSMMKRERIDVSDYIDTDGTEESSAKETSEVFNVPNDHPAAALFNLENIMGGIFSAKSKNDTASKTDLPSSSTDICEQLIKLISEGSGFGINVVVSSSEYQIIKETMRFGDNLLSKMLEVIVYSLSDNDADLLIPDVRLSGCSDNIVYFYDGIKSKFQLKPYITPSAADLCAYLSVIGGKQ